MDLQLGLPLFSLGSLKITPLVLILVVLAYLLFFRK